MDANCARDHAAFSETEGGRSNRPVWTAALGEPARWSNAGRAELESRPRMAAAMIEEFAGTRAGNQERRPWTLAQGRSIAIVRQGLS